MNSHIKAELDRVQREAVQKAVKCLSDGSRAQVVMATGTGKTRVGALVANELCSKKKVNSRFVCAVLVPRAELASQAAVSWAKHMPQPFTYVCVGGSGGVAQRASNDIAELASRELASERPRAAAINLQCVASAVQGLRRWFEEDRKQALFVVFSTYQSLACLSAFESIDLCLFDEAHRSVAKSDLEPNEVRLFQKALADGETVSVGENTAVLPTISKRLFLTATRRIGAGRGMDSETDYGPVAYHLNYREALRFGIVCRLQVKVFIVQRADVTLLLGENSSLSMRKAAAILFTTHTLMTKYNCSRAIVACHDVEEAKLVASGSSLDCVRNALGNSERFVCITEESNANNRRDAVTLLSSAGDARIVCTNVRVLSEGVDIPRLDTAIVGRHMTSVIDIVQLLGRIVRPCDNKTEAYVLVPVYVDEGDAHACVKSMVQFFSRVFWELTEGVAEVVQVVRQPAQRRERQPGLPPSEEPDEKEGADAAEDEKQDEACGENSDDGPIDDIDSDEAEAAEVDGKEQVKPAGSSSQSARPAAVVIAEEDIAKAVPHVGGFTASSISSFEVLEVHDSVAVRPASCALLAPALVRRAWLSQFVRYVLNCADVDKNARSKWLSRQRRRMGLSYYERFLLENVGLLHKATSVTVDRLREIGVDSLLCSKSELKLKVPEQEAEYLYNWMRRQVESFDKFVRSGKQTQQLKLDDLVAKKFVIHNRDGRNREEQYRLHKPDYISRLRHFNILSLLCSKSDLEQNGATPEEAVELEQWMVRQVKDFEHVVKTGKPKKRFETTLWELVDAGFVHESKGNFSLNFPLPDYVPPPWASGMVEDEEAAVQDVDNVNEPVAVRDNCVDDDDDVDDKLVDSGAMPVDVADQCGCVDVRNVNCIFDRVCHDYDEHASDLLSSVREHVGKHFSLAQPEPYVRQRPDSPIELATMRRNLNGSQR
jgi:superfamily II DNA or RNA helicase